MLSAETLAAITADIEQLGVSESTLAHLRAKHQGLHFTYCLDDDVGVQNPAHQGAGYNIYLVDGRDHCLKFTDDLGDATGLVLAEVIDDD